MNRWDRYGAQDERDFEQVLDQALHYSWIRTATERADAEADTEQLRTQALNARATIMGVAHQEYRRYLRLRTHAERATCQAARNRDASGVGRGLLDALGLLFPVVAAVAALIFLGLGYSLRLLHSRSPSATADELVVTGWITAGVAALAVLLALAGVMVTAVRNSTVQRVEEADATEPVAAAAAARRVWQQTLLERGVLPFLRARLPAAHTDAVTASTLPIGTDTAQTIATEAGPDPFSLDSSNSVTIRPDSPTAHER
ncbi:hypothetical protein DMH15_22510 [Streptomyces sp. WAC 06725]|uniref:hypothetical protein n=1 Tax=Streptomyces sp. WAC 06725 TaxID=2203209 RepID=UPI000F742117|nr:hypothetical protein [Streptomyces sp. WAC 06725]RSO32841.1 hypothetical protein DMH15_22510 [Streptomyces sp. WAC 06725]